MACRAGARSFPNAAGLLLISPHYCCIHNSSHSAYATCSGLTPLSGASRLPSELLILTTWPSTTA
jgi:hypothetical protein